MSLLLTILSFAICYCNATTYFFDPNLATDNSKSGLSESDAFGRLCSWQSSAFQSKFVDNDVLVLLPGDHKCSSWRLTKVYSKLVFEGRRGANGEWAVVTSMYHRGSGGIVLRGVHLVEQLRCDRATPASGCDNLVIERCLIGPSDADFAAMTKAQLAMSTANTLSSQGDGCVVRENFIRYQRRGAIIGSNTVFESNVVEFCVGDAIRVAGSNVVVRNNVVRGALEVDDDHRDILQVYAGRVLVKNVSIYQNWFSSERPGWETMPGAALHGDTQGVSAFDDNIDDLLMENNCILVNHHHGSTWQTVKGTIRYNTLFNPVPKGAPGYIGTCWLDVKNMTGPIVANVGTALPVSADNLEVNIAMAPMLFVNLTATDVRLKAASQLRNFLPGAVPAGLLDVTGTPRTTNDAGCLSAASSDKTGKWWGSLPIDPLSTGPVDYPPPLDGAPVLTTTTTVAPATTSSTSPVSVDSAGTGTETGAETGAPTNTGTGTTVTNNESVDASSATITTASSVLVAIQFVVLLQLNF